MVFPSTHPRRTAACCSLAALLVSTAVPHAAITERATDFLLSDSNYSVAISKTNGAIISFKGTASEDIATGGASGLWSAVYTNASETNGLITAASFAAGSATNPFQATISGDGLLLNYSNARINVSVTITNRGDGLDMSAVVTTGPGVGVRELMLPAKLRFAPAELYRFIAPSHSSDGVGAAYNSNFFRVQPETNAATWKGVDQADAGLGYRNLYGSGLVFTNDTPVPVSFTTNGQAWLGAVVSGTWNNSPTVVNRPPAPGQSDIVLIDSPNGPYFSGSRLGGGGGAGYLLRLGGRVNGATAVSRSLDIVLAAIDFLAQNPGGRSKVGVLSMERGPVIGETWPSEVRTDQWVSGLRSILPGAIQVVEVRDMPEIEAAATGSDYLAILNPYGELLPASLGGGVAASVNTIRAYVQAGGNWVEVGGHPFFYALQPELYYSINLPYPAAFADFYQLETAAGNASLFGVQNVLTDPANPWATNSLFVPGNLSWGADASGGYFERGFVTYIQPGQTWQSPAVRLVAGHSAPDALTQYASANGITRSLGAKMSAPLLNAFKRSLLIRAYGTANQLAATVPQLPSPSILHFTDYLKGGFDKEYPDHLPPNTTNFGTPAEFLALLAAATNAGILTMPYTNPTLWGESPRGPTFLAAGEAPLARRTDGSLAAETYFDLPGYAATPWHPGTQAANRKTVGLFTPSTPTNFPSDTHYPVDLFFQDQVGARSWQYDLNPSAPSATAYTHGLAAIGAEDSLRLPVSTENGFDRLINFHSQFCGLAWGLVPTPGAPFWRRFLAERYDPATWTIFPLAQHLAHDKVAFTYNNLGAPVANDETVAWSIGLGYGMTYVVFPNDLASTGNREWLRWIDRVQKSVAGRYIGEKVNAFTHTWGAGNGAINATYGLVSVTANLEATNQAAGARTLAPHGFVATAPGLVAARMIEPGGSLPVSFVAETNLSGGADIWIYSTGNRTTAVELPAGFNGTVVSQVEGGVPATSLVSSNRLTVTLPAGTNPAQPYLWRGSVTPPIRGRTALLDLGTSYLTANPAVSLNGTTNFWNNITASNTTNLVFSDNTASGWSFRFVTPYSFNPTNAFAPLPRSELGAFALPTATQDGAFYFTTNTALSNGITAQVGGLDRSNRYTVRIYGARDATTTRTTIYTVTGTNSQTNSLQTSGTGMDTNSSGSACNYNASRLVTFYDVAPDANSQITVNFRSTNDLAYLNALSIEEFERSAPSISLIGNATLFWTRGVTFTDPGAAVTDNVDAARTVTGGGTVDTSTPGTYTLTYAATDSSGNTATPVTRTVIVANPKFLIDFGRAGMTNWYSGATPPVSDANGNAWNALDNSAYWILRDSAGSTNGATGLGFIAPPIATFTAYNGPAGGVTNNPPTTNDLAAVTINSNALGMLGNREAAFEYVCGRNVRFVINTLSPSKRYKLTFFSSRKFEGDTATTFSVFNASNTVTATNGDTVFDPTGLLATGTLNNRSTNNGGANGLHNQDTVLALNNLAPSSSGSLYVSFVGSTGGVGVLNAMSIEEDQTAAPVITSSNSVSGTASLAFTYQITASNNPTSFGATGLPAGLAVNTNTGLISGIPISATNASAQISAANSAGTNTASLNIVIAPAMPPVIVSTNNLAMYGANFRYQIATALSNATSYAATGLPAGVTLDPLTGLITGTLSSPVTGSFDVSAINSEGTNTITVNLAAYGQECLIDFGQIPTTNAASGRVWNNWLAGGNVISNVADSTGAGTGYFLEFTTGVSWGTNSGVTASPSMGVFNEQSVVADGLIATTSLTNGSTFTISKLNPSSAYTVEVLGSFNAPDTRVTAYTIAGSTTNTGSLTNSGTGIGGAVNFSTNTLTFPPMYPDRNGLISVTYRVTSGTSGYLNAVRLATTNYPAPASGYLPLVNRWLDQEALAPLPTNAVVFVGSSSIRRWEALTRDFADYQVIQRGMGGSTLGDLNQLLDDVVLRHAPRAVVVWSGVNDVYAGRTADYVFGQFTNFISTTTNALPSAKIFYIGITRNPTFDGNSAMNTQRTNANAMISDFVATNGNANLRYIDLPAFFEPLGATTNQATSSPADLWYYQVDFGHLNQRGYDVWRTNIRQNLAAGGIYPDRATTINPLAPSGGQRILFDFGPSDTTNGRPTTGPDQNGNQWNNWPAVNGGARVVTGEGVANLLDTAGAATGVSIRLTGDFSVNGRLNGGLTNIPSLALGNLGISTATEDYFFTTADGLAGGGDDDPTGGLMISGLNPGLTYDFRFFGSRDVAGRRDTSYQVMGAATNSAAVLQTSGAGSGINASTGNNSTVATVYSVRPNAYGDIFVDVTSLSQASSSNVVAYLSAMEISTISPYEAWARANGFAPGVGNGLDESPPTAGASNLRRFAFDGDPAALPAGASRFAGGIARPGGTNTLTYTLPARNGAVFSGTTNLSATVDGLTYRVQGSSDLLNWNQTIEEVLVPATNDLPPLSVAGPGGYQYRSFRLADQSLSKGFLRVEVQPAVGSRDAFAGASGGLQAEKFAAAEGVQLEPGSAAIGSFDSGDWIKYANVDFGQGGTSVTFSAAKAGSGGAVEIRLNSPTGRLIGTFTPQPTAGWGDYREQVAQLSGFVGGVHDLYLVATGGTGVCNLDWLRFSNYVLAWSDEFTGSTLNTNNWSPVWNGDVANGELQFYTDRTNNVSVGGGVLRLTAERETYTGQGPWMAAPKSTDYTSGLVESLNKAQPLYGKIEASMKVPRGAGLWPAFWMLGANYFTPGVGWPKCGEIDIMEYSGASEGFTAAFHTGAYNYMNGGGGVANVQAYSLADADTAFHVYGVEWTPARVAFHVDGKIVLTAEKAVMGASADQWPFDQPFWLKLNVAVGGPYGGDPAPGTFPKTMEVDWVRVYQEPPK